MKRKIIGIIIITTIIASTATSMALAGNENALNKAGGVIWDFIHANRDRIEELETNCELLEEKCLEYETHMEELEDRIEELEGSSSGASGLGEPDYDSGWVSMPRTKSFEHGLGTTELFVYVIGKGGSISGIHQWGYGGITDLGLQKGLYWRTSSSNHVTLYRYRSDSAWNQVRVLIWKIPIPEP